MHCSQNASAHEKGRLAGVAWASVDDGSDISDVDIQARAELGASFDVKPQDREMYIQGFFTGVRSCMPY